MSRRSAKRLFGRGHLFVRDLEMQFLKNYPSRYVCRAVGTPSLLHVPSRSDHNARVRSILYNAGCVSFRDKGRAIRYWDFLSVYVVGDNNGNVAWTASLVLLVYSCPSANSALTGQMWRGIGKKSCVWTFCRDFFLRQKTRCVEAGGVYQNVRVSPCLLWTHVVSFATNKINEINPFVSE